MQQSASVVVIGGGILGATTAWELSSRGLDVAVFESATFGQESTGKSAAIVRMHYSNPEVVRMALRSRDAFVRLPEVFGCEPVFTTSGWLFLVDADDVEHAKHNRRMQL